MITSTKIGLSVIETGWLLQKTEAQVRGMLKRAELSYAVDGRLVAVGDVEALLETALASVCFRRLCAGLLVAPRPEKRWGRPASLFAAFDAMMLAAPALVVDEQTESSEIVPNLMEVGKNGSLRPVISFLL